MHPGWKTSHSSVNCRSFGRTTTIFLTSGGEVCQQTNLAVCCEPKNLAVLCELSVGRSTPNSKMCPGRTKPCSLLQTNSNSKMHPGAKSAMQTHTRSLLQTKLRIGRSVAPTVNVSQSSPCQKILTSRGEVCQRTDLAVICEPKNLTVFCKLET